MNHWVFQPNTVAGGEDVRTSVTVFERDQTVVCPKPRRIGLLRNVDHHPVRSLRCHFSHQVELCESKAETDILDIILMKDGFGGEEVQVHTQVIDIIDSSAPPFFCGSPPSRVSNPITQDARFRDDININIDINMVPSPIPPLSPRKGGGGGGGGGCVRGKFGNSPAVRIEGFDCLDRDSRNCSIPALA